MKYIIIILVFLTSFLYSQEWISIDYTTQIGYTFSSYVSYVIPSIIPAPFDASIKLDAITFKFIKIGGYTFIQFGTVSPQKIAYSFNLGIQPVKGFSIFYEHNYSLLYRESIQTQSDRVCIELKGTLTF